MKKNTCELIVVLDRSGSMENIWGEMIGGLNAFVEEQKRLPGEARFTLVVFDDRYDIVHNGVPLQNMQPLTGKEFPPRGGTALYDALGRTIDEVGVRLSRTPEEQRPQKVIFNVITDGQNNASKEYTREVVAGKIAHQQKVYSWEFLFLAANIDAQAVASSLGILRSFGFSADVEGARLANEIYISSTTRSRMSS